MSNVYKFITYKINADLPNKYLLNNFILLQKTPIICTYVIIFIKFVKCSFWKTFYKAIVNSVTRPETMLTQ